ncbi:transposase [Gallaecimonas pentaromativorans]|uniref:Transposase n=1 Tax=Gallaecimonas pentaromativorans TaxID=584787 RepID=A0A3N1PUC2_9GAMM|nr:transposase [Gallaecimonas pentaromativorans]ROQ30367.1 transposase [Gallaecimonas pentaromativorans]
MPAYKTGKRTQQYSLEFKKKAVLWSHEPHRNVKEVAEALDIHPFMLSRWRKEFREGKYGMANNAPIDSQERNIRFGCGAFAGIFLNSSVE